MITQEQQLELFLDAINIATSTRSDIIRQEAEKIRQAELDKAREKAAQMSKSLLTFELEKARIQSNRILSETQNEQRKKLFEKRQEIAESVFFKAKSKLIEYTHSEEYKKMLIKSILKIANIYKDKPFSVLVKESDIESISKLREVRDLHIELLTDNSILIGGCKALCDSAKTMIDDTLDSRLEQQKEWFYSNSGLEI